MHIFLIKLNRPLSFNIIIKIKFYTIKNFHLIIEYIYKTILHTPLNPINI